MGVKGGTLLSGWRGLLVKDWTFLSTINLGSGLPLTPIYASIIPGTALNGTVRAEYTGASLYAAPAGYYLNPAAVAAPPPGQWGNAGMTLHARTGPVLDGRFHAAFVPPRRPVHAERADRRQ